MVDNPLHDVPGQKKALLVFACFLAEFLLFTALRNIAGPHKSPVLFYLSSILFTLAAFFCLRTVRLEEVGYSTRASRSTKLLWLGLVTLGLFVFLPKLSSLFAAMPIDPQLSDIVPSIQIFVGRFLEGEPVYAPITDFSYPLYPTYLPLMWMPFLVPDWLGVDYRWMGAAVLAVSFLGYSGLLLRRTTPFFELILKLALPFIVLQGIIDTEPSIFQFTIETMIIGFYLLLATSLFSSSLLWRGAALLLCLLSRYSLVFWVPLWLLLIWQQEGRKQALRLAAVLVVGIVVIYIIPFLSKDWNAFAMGQAAYSNAALGEWQHLSPATGKPEHLYNGVGFAFYFFEHASGDLLRGVQLIRITHATVSLAVVAAATGFWFVAKPRIDYRIYALLALKLYLATFYAFIQVPYLYLTSLVLFMSLPLLIWVRPAAPAASSVAPSDPHV